MSCHEPINQRQVQVKTSEFTFLGRGCVEMSMHAWNSESRGECTFAAKEPSQEVERVMT